MSFYLKGLSATLSSMALPYGFTLTVWSAGELIRRAHPKPTVADVFLFLLGAIAAYAVLRLAVGETEEQASGLGKKHQYRAGAIHVVAIGAAAGIAYGAAMSPPLWAWPVASFAAAFAYLALVSLELAFEVRNQD